MPTCVPPERLTLRSWDNLPMRTPLPSLPTGSEHFTMTTLDVPSKSIEGRAELFQAAGGCTIIGHDARRTAVHRGALRLISKQSWHQLYSVAVTGDFWGPLSPRWFDAVCLTKIARERTRDCEDGIGFRRSNRRESCRIGVLGKGHGQEDGRLNCRPGASEHHLPVITHCDKGHDGRERSFYSARLGHELGTRVPLTHSYLTLDPRLH